MRLPEVTSLASGFSSAYRFNTFLPTLLRPGFSFFKSPKQRNDILLTFNKTYMQKNTTIVQIEFLKGK